MEIINANFKNASIRGLNEWADVIFGFCDPSITDYFEGENVHNWFFHDIIKPSTGIVAPNQFDMQLLEEKLRQVIENQNERILIHCSGGVSRSGAATLFLLLLNNDGNVDKGVDKLFQINPGVSPNEWMTKWIDDRMCLSGRLVKKVNHRWMEERLRKDPEIFD